MKTLFTIATLALLLSCALGQTGPYSYLVKTEHANVLTIAACKPGEYLSVDGRCLHDQTGEGHPAGDNCNSCSCMDAACHQEACTAMACLRGDDPAPIQPEPAQTGPERVTADERKEGATK